MMNDNHEVYMEGVGYFIPATEGLTYKGGINSAPTAQRPPAPTLSKYEQNTSSSTNSTTTTNKNE